MTTRQAGGIALVLIVVSVFLMAVFRTIELIEERTSLTELRELQDKAVRDTATVRRQFEALAAGIVGLAATGDGSAKTIVDELRRQGVQLPAVKR